jgi:hypothetical protein
MTIKTLGIQPLELLSILQIVELESVPIEHGRFYSMY